MCIRDRLIGEPVEMYFSGDGGQGDATSMGCYIVARTESRFVLYRAAAYYHSGRDTGQVKAMSVYAKELRVFIRWCREHWPNIRQGEVYIDPACKSLREEMNLIGMDTVCAPNNAHDINGGKKGIEVGIERAQNLLTDGRFFLINGDAYGQADFVREVGMYCRDDHGNPIDAYNHAMDEFRYAVNVFYQEYVL